MDVEFNKKTEICCICGNVFTGYGNDPWPVNTNDDAYCCDRCNYEVVLPARLMQLQRR